MPDHDDRNEHLGPRRAALEERRRTKRKRRTLFGTVVTVSAVIAGVAVVILAAREVVQRDDPAPRADASPPPPPNTTLVIGERGSGSLAWLSLLTSDDERASVAYLPAHTAVEVPGRGLQGLHEAYASGGSDLTLVAIENLLGVSIERYVVLESEDVRDLVAPFEPLSVNVPEDVRVPVGRQQTRLLFAEGEQELTSAEVGRLLFTMGVDGDDLSLGSRHLAFWHGLLGAGRSDPASFTSAIPTSALQDSDAESSEVASAIGDLAALPASATKLRSLPVTSLEVPGSPLYVPDADEVAAFVEAMIGDVSPEGLARVQILNGNGAPGIGQEVAALLVGKGFRVILSGNAPRLDHKETLIVVYDDEGRAAADRARELLGVGEVQVSTQDQGIVDITIVVGKDFLRKR